MRSATGEEERADARAGSVLIASSFIGAFPPRTTRPQRVRGGANYRGRIPYCNIRQNLAPPVAPSCLSVITPGIFGSYRLPHFSRRRPTGPHRSPGSLCSRIWYRGCYLGEYDCFPLFRFVPRVRLKIRPHHASARDKFELSLRAYTRRSQQITRRTQVNRKCPRYRLDRAVPLKPHSERVWE
jgi:hypothetical protein